MFQYFPELCLFLRSCYLIIIAHIKKTNINEFCTVFCSLIISSTVRVVIQCSWVRLPRLSASAGLQVAFLCRESPSRMITSRLRRLPVPSFANFVRKTPSCLRHCCLQHKIESALSDLCPLCKILNTNSLRTENRQILQNLRTNYSFATFVFPGCSFVDYNHLRASC